ncbi:MAG: hypothetical protein OXE50_14210 [Chloroflexi bacterium]|nr:hypothetical protein [Chloroflexota bacterium]
MSTNATWRGHFNQRHNACLNFTLERQNDGATVAFEGIIDTGFSGFVQIPMNAASALGLISPPLQMGATILANGAKQPVVLKQVPVTINGDIAHGLCQIPLTGNSPILIGMDLLRRFQRVLIVSSKQGIFLPQEQDVTISGQTPTQQS